ncbi:MAG: hypothetical protein EOM28_00250 [Clostridia bacterium]|nr:hypothetical protein [Clostridia bacterium]
MRENSFGALHWLFGCQACLHLTAMKTKWFVKLMQTAAKTRKVRRLASLPTHTKKMVMTKNGLYIKTEETLRQATFPLFFSILLPALIRS